MFKNEFQGGTHFEVFSAQGNKDLTLWKLSGPSNIKKEFHKDVKSFVYCLEGSPIATKMQLPKDQKNPLTLIQKFVVFQVFVPKGQDFAIDLGLTDDGRNKRRLVLSTIHRETSCNPLHCKLPLGLITRAKWLNLCLDLQSLVEQAWRGQNFRSIDNICISANCRMRRIFTMKCQPPDTSMDEELYGFHGTNSRDDIDSIPKQCQFAGDVIQETQVINTIKLRYYEGKGSRPPDPGSSGRPGSGREPDLNSSGGRRSNSDAYHIAFGSKISGTVQPRKGSGREGSAGSTGRSQSHETSGHVRSKSDATDSTLSSSRNVQSSKAVRQSESRRESQTGGRERKNSDPGTNTEDPDIKVDKESLRTSHTWTDGADNKEEIPFVKPHPPKMPSSERVRRRKPRVKSAGSAGKERTASMGSAGDSREDISYASTTSGYSSAQHSRGHHGNHDRVQLPQPTVVANDEEVDRFLREMNTGRDANRSESESDPSSQNTTHADGDDTIMGVIQTLKHQGIGDDDDDDDEDDDDDADSADIDDSDEDERRLQYSGKLYQFSSPPKSAKVRLGGARVQRRAKKETHKKDPNHSHSHGSRSLEDSYPSRDTGSRAQLESDFVLNESSGEEPSVRTRIFHKVPSPRLKHETSPKHRSKGSKQDMYMSPNGLLVPGGVGEGGDLQRTPGNSQSRVCISRGSLREISKSELRLSTNSKPYNSDKYKMQDLSESFETKMLLSLQRQAMEESYSSDEDHARESRPTGSYSKFNFEAGGGDSSDDTSQSTFRGTGTGATHNYQDEMRAIAISGEFLSQSNPRDWGNVFSPPIVLPGSVKHTSASQLSPEQLLNVSPKNPTDYRPKVGNPGGIPEESDKEEELDLLYDPVLNCYYDPHTCKYYELA